ncbi:MAG: molybdopterin synthase sulfur carrier subunit [Bacteroidia bacterium]|jgi:molybdopterin synthase sulfur carrier subunit
MIKILAFGAAVDAVDQREFELSLDSESALLEVVNKLYERYPKLLKLPSAAFAINEEYATLEQIIKPGDTLAIIPPVSGG